MTQAIGELLCESCGCRLEPGEAYAARAFDAKTGRAWSICNVYCSACANKVGAEESRTSAEDQLPMVTRGRKRDDAEFARRYELLRENGWNLTRTGRLLGIDARVLRRQMTIRGIKVPVRVAKPKTIQVRPTKYGLEKRCIRCREWLPLECFHRNSCGAFGVANICAACLSERRRGVAA